MGFIGTQTGSGQFPAPLKPALFKRFRKGREESGNGLVTTAGYGLIQCLPVPQCGAKKALRMGNPGFHQGLLVGFPRSHAPRNAQATRRGA